MKRSESPSDDQETGKQPARASGGQPPRKRVKVTEAYEDSEDVELQEGGKSPALVRLKSLPEEDLEGDEDTATVHGRAASPRMAAFDVAATKPPPPPAPPELMAQSFPKRLMEMLDSEVVPDAMWWAEEGKAFAMDLSKFGDVLHHHFQATKYASFTRKLNKWGFRKLNNIDPETPDSVVLYRHELFQKGNLDLLATMSTKRKKKEKKARDTKKRGASEDGNVESDSERKDTSEESDFGVQIDDEKQDTGTEEEKVHSVGPSSPLRLPRHLQSIQDAESKSDNASDFVRQQMQQQLSLASSLATHRMTSQPTASFSQERPSLAVGSMQRDQSSRQLLESLLAQEAQQHQRQQQRLELALLRQQQESLASEMVVQRQLAATASASRLPMHLVSAITLEERLAALQDPTLRGIHHLTGGAGRIIPRSRSHSMSDLPAAQTAMSQRNFSDLAARLALQQVQNQATDFGMSLSSQPQNLSELRAAMEARSQAEIASALQAMASPPSPAQARLALPSDARMTSLDLLSPRMATTGMHAGLHHSRSFPDASALLQMQLELQHQQAQLRRASSAGAVSAAAGATSLSSPRNTAASLPSVSAVSLAPAPSPADQQLLEMFLEQQRLQQQLQDEHQRRRQGR